MVSKNIILLVGNGFDIAHQMKSKFSDFATYYLNQVLVPELVNCITNRQTSHPYFKRNFLKNMAKKGGGVIRREDPYDMMWSLAHGEHIQELITYLNQNYNVPSLFLSNSLLAKLYFSTDKNWFDIENLYFRELIPLKNSALEKQSSFDPKNLLKLNLDFEEIKLAVGDYLKGLPITNNQDIEAFFYSHLSEVKSVYVVNFNYTSTVLQYFSDSANVTVNHIHGSLENNNIVFGYGNDQNNDYQEMKNSEIDGFLQYFKTFDYLNDINYNRVYSEALDSLEQYEVYVIGHSLGMTDKTLLSEILNSDKCKKIHLFKRKDLQNEPITLKEKFRNSTYSASRILTNEKILRQKIINFKDSRFFP